MDNSQNNKQNQRVAGSKKALLAIAIVLVLVAVAGAVTYFVLTNKPEEQAATASTPPAIPTKGEVDQIITSVDDKIDQANADRASADAALKDADNPVKVDL